MTNERADVSVSETDDPRQAPSPSPSPQPSDPPYLVSSSDPLGEGGVTRSGEQESLPDSRGSETPWSPSARDRLFRLAYRLLWNRADAEDAVQDALLAAHDRSAQLKDAEKWWPWVCSIVVQRCRLLGRRASQRKRHERILAELTQTHETPRSSGSAEAKALVIELLDELPRRQREVLVLRHLQGMTFNEIAAVLVLSPETARVHAQRGRARLLALIEKRHPEWIEESARECDDP